MVTTTRPPGATDAVSKDLVALVPCCAATGSRANNPTTPATAATTITANPFLIKAFLPLVAFVGPVCSRGSVKETLALATIEANGTSLPGQHQAAPLELTAGVKVYEPYHVVLADDANLAKEVIV